MTATELIEVLRSAYEPCRHFERDCRGSCIWDPGRGLVPCAFGGATGTLDEVRLVIVTAEPGAPPRQPDYHGAPEAMVRRSIKIFTDAMLNDLDRKPRSPFHPNMRRILACFWPGRSLAEQLRRTWTTNTVLCQAESSVGSHSRKIATTCAEAYLAPQLALLPHAFRLVLGAKARDRMERADLRFDAYGLDPCTRKSDHEKHRSWQDAADMFHQWLHGD